jgi:hypothetical protein
VDKFGANLGLGSLDSEEAHRQHRGVLFVCRHGVEIACANDPRVGFPWSPFESLLTPLFVVDLEPQVSAALSLFGFLSSPGMVASLFKGLGFKGLGFRV